MVPGRGAEMLAVEGVVLGEEMASLENEVTLSCPGSSLNLPHPRRGYFYRCFRLRRVRSRF